MQANGYDLKVEDVQNLSAVKREYQVPANLQSCHTAIVDGYIIEGHVPIREIQRLLLEKPPVKGLAVAGMPVGSPGMEVDGVGADPFDVIAFYPDGGQEVYASYP